MWDTEVPTAGFSFGALYAFLIIVSLGLFVLRIAMNKKDKEAK